MAHVTRARLSTLLGRLQHHLSPSHLVTDHSLHILQLDLDAMTRGKALSKDVDEVIRHMHYTLGVTAQQVSLMTGVALRTVQRRFQRRPTVKKPSERGRGQPRKIDEDDMAVRILLSWI